MDAEPRIAMTTVLMHIGLEKRLTLSIVNELFTLHGFRTLVSSHVTQHLTVVARHKHHLGYLDAVVVVVATVVVNFQFQVWSQLCL